MHRTLTREPFRTTEFKTLELFTSPQTYPASCKKPLRRNDVDTPRGAVEIIDDTNPAVPWGSAVSWGSIVAGGVVAAALSLALLALGVGLGLASVSPWGDSAVSASTFNNIAGIYLVLIAVMSSAIGGYLAARLRTKWTGLHTNEVFFRDTAHGFIAWGFATVLSATALGGAATHIASGAATGLGVAATGAASQNVSPSRVYVDKLFRTEAPAPAAGSPAPGGANASAPASNEAARAEVNRLWVSSFRADNDFAPADRTYIARLVAAQTGMSQQDAERRVSEVVNEAKAATDKARRGAVKLAFWLTAAMIFGAFAASLAAVEGGQLRDGTWSGRTLTKRAWA
jgi:hypothetical protein